MTAVLLCYLGLALLLTAEEAGAFLLPGDIALVAAGVVAGRGDTSPFVTWVVAAGAMIAGASILFVLVRRFHFVHGIVPENIRARVERHGVAGVFAARLVPGLRNGTVFAAAASPMRYDVFLTGLAPAAVIWSGLLLGLGYVGGPAFLGAFNAFEHSPVLRVVSLSFGLLTAGFVTYRLLTRRKTLSVVPSRTDQSRVA